MIERELDTLEATAALGAAIASVARPGLVVELEGALGAGKTTLTKSIAAGLGVRTEVTSPTYTLVAVYACAPDAPVAELVHADLWRLEQADELEDLDVFERAEQGALCVIEWADRCAGVFGQDRLQVALEPDGEARRCSIDATDPELLGALERALGAP